MDNLQTTTSVRLSRPPKLLADTLKFYKENFKVIFLIMLMPLVFFTVDYLTQNHSYSNSIYFSFLFLIEIIISYLAGIAILTFITCKDSLKLPFLDYYKRALKYFWVLLITSLLGSLVIAGGTWLFFIPGIILSGYLALIEFVVVDGNKWGYGAIAISKYLISGNWWRVLWRSLFVGFFVILVIIFIRFLIAIISGNSLSFIFQSNYTNGLADFVETVLYLIFITPITSIYLYKIYQELQIIKPEPSEEEIKKPRTWFIVLTVIGVLGAIVAVILLSILITFISSALITA